MLYFCQVLSIADVFRSLNLTKIELDMQSLPLFMQTAYLE